MTKVFVIVIVLVIKVDYEDDKKIPTMKVSLAIKVKRQRMTIDSEG